ncbi:MAG: universal stress protein [Thermodesulfobacteriota bacterium]
MIKHILIPQDGSDHSSAALDYGVWLAKRTEAKITGLYVVDIVTLEGPFFHDISGSLGFEPYLNFSTKMREVLDARGEELLKGFVERCESDGVECESVLASGVVVSEICERAKLADLVIMGRFGINVEFEYGLLGSTAEGVIRRASRPVIVVPDRFIEPAKPLLAYDGGATAAKAMHSAAELVKTLGLPLTILAVGAGEEGDRLLSEAEEYLKPYGVEVEYKSREGAAYKEIVSCYEEGGHDILFMGVSHHSRIVEMVLGSTTEHVVRAVQGPVFLER